MDADLYVVNVEAFVYHQGKYLMIVRGHTEEIAPGALTPPGGKVEGARREQDVLEATLRRELLEETGVEVDDGLVYVESHSFEGGGQVIVDVVFLARYQGGDAAAADAEEVAAIEWLTYDEIMADQRCLPWTRESLRRADLARRRAAW